VINTAKSTLCWQIYLSAERGTVKLYFRLRKIESKIFFSNIEFRLIEKKIRIPNRQKKVNTHLQQICHNNNMFFLIPLEKTLSSKKMAA